MGKYSRLWIKIVSGRSDGNISFSDLCQLLLHLAFEERIKGDHHIFSRDDVEEIINIQPYKNKAKPYQVRQIRNILIKYKIGEAEDD